MGVYHVTLVGQERAGGRGSKVNMSERRKKSLVNGRQTKAVRACACLSDCCHAAPGGADVAREGGVLAERF